jgi:hypothetical protein
VSGEFSMSMGPGRNQWCCGKPVGCNIVRGMNPDDPGSCSFLNHRWKLDNIPGHREAMAARRRAASGGLVLGPDGDSVPVRLMRGEHVYDAYGRLMFDAGEEPGQDPDEGE